MKTVYLLSDTHFGSYSKDENSRITQFEHFGKSLESTDSELFLLGDIFDFWISYKTAIRSDYFRVCSILYNLVKSGVKVTLITGNHEFMNFDFLEEEIGITVIRGFLIKKIFNKEVYLCHGDALKGDWKYRALHRFLNNKIAQKFYKILHPNIGIGMALSLSELSRKKSSKSNKTFSKDRENWYINKSDSIMKEKTADILIMGHTHKANLVATDNGIYANCGSWLFKSNIIVLTENKIELVHFSEGNFSTEKSIPF